MLLMALIGTVGAVIPDTVTFTTSPYKEWIVANGADSATLSLEVLNNTIGFGSIVGPVPELRVEFSVNDTGLASVTPSVLVTDLGGMVTSQLFAKTKSGTVLISAKVFYKEDDSNPLETVKNKTYTYSQKIDHDTPYAISYDNFPNGVISVGEELPLTIRLRDYWNNVVENKNPAATEKITFSIQGSPGDLAVFKNGASWLSYLDVPVDNIGNFNTTLKVSTLPGYHSILVKPLDMPISGHPYYVRTIANGIPARIISLVEITPGSTGSASAIPYPYIEADGFDQYLITYTVFDRYGNPVSDRVLKVNTTIPGELKFLPATTDLGEVKINYGPKDQVGQVTITAVSVDNSSAVTYNTVKFINSTAIEMLLTANPESMPSRDVDSSFKSEVRSKVVDINGNGAPNQIVTFSLGPASYLETYTITDTPSLDSTSAVTDSDGYATVYFRPGGFTPSWGDPQYDDTATGRCTVTAKWNNTPQNLTLIWKNYPYLSAETLVSPNVVNVTDNVTVTLRLKGDGWALQPKPIDVVLCTDRSGSMLQGNSPDRMVAAMSASKNFNSKMNSNRDRVGLVSFGDNSATHGWANLTPTRYWSTYYGIWRWSYEHIYGSWYWVSQDGDYECDYCENTYCDNYNTDSVHQQYVNTYYKGNPRNYSATMATVEQTLSFNHATVDNSIDQMVPAGGTPMREGLYWSVKMLRDNPRSAAVPAVILLSDGDWNTGGNPEGASDAVAFPADSITSTTSIIQWAKQKNITIYTIGLQIAAGSTIENYLKSYATQTGGIYYPASTPAELDSIYTSIAGNLQTEAGVATKADLNYGMVNVNQQPVSGVFDYVYQSPVSTMNRTYYTKNDTTIRGPYYYNQTADWNDKNLSFDVGTIKLNQSWETTYMLKVLKPGNIDVFGVGSKISFNNNTVFLSLPKTLITALPDMSTTGSANVTKTLTIDNLTVTTNGNLANLSVDIQIKPEELNLNVLVDIYITDEDQHTTTWIKTVNLTPVINGPMFITTIDISQFQLGKEYTFYVDFINKQPGTNPIYWAQLTSNRFVRLPKPSGKYIRLE
jgi:Mg-chelatase subunit ChlD